MREPVPKAPPVQPVFNKPHLRLCWSMSLPSISAYLVGCHTRKTAPKQDENVGLRFGDSALGARDLGRVTREEVVHRLIARELGDGRQDSERVCREEDDVLGMPALAVGDVVLDVVQRIRCARVLVMLVSSKRTLRVTGSSTTFSSTVPNIWVVL